MEDIDNSDGETVNELKTFSQEDEQPGMRVFELEQSEQKFRSFVEQSIDGIVLVDEKGLVIEWNPAMERITGLSRNETIGQVCFDVQFRLYPDRYKHRDTYAKLKKAWEEFLKTGEAANLGLIRETQIQRCDETICFAQDIGFCIKTGQGFIYGGIIRDITVNKQAEQNLIRLSQHDALTGLYNRAFFEEKIQAIENQAPASVGVIICDVDGLKLVNDTLGHGAGDVMLKKAANLIRQSFEANAIVARIGGDEFSVLLVNCDRPGLENACQRIRDAVADYNLHTPQLPLSMSIGFALAAGTTSINITALLKEADNNMYREKLHRSRSTRSAIVQILMKTLEARGLITEEYANCMECQVVNMATAIGLPEHRISDLRLFARFHDIGKVGIPDKLLFKPGPITPEEYIELQRHCEIGHRIAASTPDLLPIADWVLKHHEWWNGKGYPLGLRGKEIPLECCILSIIATYNAITRDHAYRQARSHQEAVAELMRSAGSQFDPRLVLIFIGLTEGQKISSNLALNSGAESTC